MVRRGIVGLEAAPAGDPLIWATRKEILYAPDDPIRLTLEARAIVGAIHDGGYPPEAGPISRVLGLDEARTRDVLQALCTSDHPMVRTVMLEGLPMHASVNLPEGAVLQCVQCKKLINKAPCVLCWSLEETEDDWPEEDVRQADPPQSNQPTLYGPGDSGKILTMQRRVAAGYAAFCDNDAQWADDGSEQQNGTVYLWRN